MPKFVVEIPNEYDGLISLIELYKAIADATLASGNKEPFVEISKSKVYYNSDNLIPNKQALKILQVLNEYCVEIVEYVRNFPVME